MSMDWMKTFNRGQWIIHAVFTFAVVFAVGATLFALRLNHLQGTEEERTLKINSLIQNLKTDHGFEKLGKYLSWAESDKANDKLRDMSQKLAEAQELLDYKASTDLGLALRTFNRLINNNSGMSNPGDALKVLKQKVQQLSGVAQAHGYKNVSIISERMKDRLEQLHPKNAGSSIQVSYLRSDVKRLEQLIGNSSLEEGEKNGLQGRLTSMMSELELLSSLNSHSRDLQAHVKQASLALAQWLMDAEKKAQDLKGQRESKQGQLVLILASLAGFLVTSWMSLLYLFRWQKLKIGEQVEGEVKSVIEKGILGDQRFMVDHYSDLTREDIIKLLDELKLKLNLGTMLHNGLPFAGCLIDNSFRLTWHNHLFLEQFYLSEEEVRSDSFNWDFLRDYLNLEEDPVYQAMVNKIAGIYPVKVKQDEFTPMQPYEMYVTPITVNREDRVMVFFYPLVSVKEAIVEQVQASKEIIARFVELWNDEKLDEDELRLLEKDFKGHDLSDLYDLLRSIHERVVEEKDECIRTITSLEKENAAYHDALEMMKKLEEERKEIIRKEFNLAGEMKDSFLEGLDRAETLLTINKNLMQQNDDLRSMGQKMLQSSQEAAKKTKETVEILGQLESVKVDYKKLKFELMEVKAKLITINSTLMGQLPPLDEHQQKLAMRYKDELARLDFNVATLDKKLSQLDVLLAKLQMMNDKEVPLQMNFSFQTSQKDHETRETLTEIQRTMSSEEGRIVDQFKGLHHLIKTDLNKSHEAQAVAHIEQSLSQ